MKLKNISQVIDSYDVFLFDFWGVIIKDEDNTCVDVINAINTILVDKTVFFISNSRKSRYESMQKLKSWGINLVNPESVITAGEVARQMINNSWDIFGIECPTIYHLGHEDNKGILEGIKLRLSSNIKQSDILLISVFRDEGAYLEEFDDLLKTAVDTGTINICANPDTIIPRFGKERYCAGYFAAKLETFGGKVIYTGKPYQVIYEKLLKQISHIPRNKILMIGDTLETDILGAINSGIHSALVLTGNIDRLYSGYISLEDKLERIYKDAATIKILPNFMIEFS